MGDNRSSIRCPGCGMVNWADADGCKRCGEWFNVGDYAPPGEVSPAPYSQDQYGQQHYGQQHYGGQYYEPHQYGGQQPGQTYAPTYAQPYGRPGYGDGSRKKSALPRVLVGLLVFLALAGTLGTLGVTSLLKTKPPEWRYYKSARGNYSVRLPAEAKLDPPDLQLDPTLNFKSVGANLSRSEGCYVLYTDYPHSVEGITADELEQMAREVAQATNAEVIEIRPISLGSHKGVELLSKTKTFVTQTIHWRVYTVGSRLYVLALVGREKGQLAQESDEFFDSFSVPAAEEEGAGAESE